ncbi:protein spaetzle 5-like isoform X2 [Danaus plexippus]|nr:protein spaetzle 5-like isoform X2 [Danaus plexippus]
MFSDNAEPMSLCSTKPRSIPVQGAKDKNGNWRFIINDLKNPIQVFRAEICRNPLGPCSENIAFEPGYYGACLQKVVFREMFYLKEEINEIGQDYFEVPTCCSCSLIRKDNYK